MTTEKIDTTGLRPAPDALVLFGAALALAGYLLPWFRLGDGYLWSFSGWAYASLSTGGGWTLITFGWLATALIAGLWARSMPGAAMTTLVSSIGGLFFALAVVAVSFAEFRERGSLNWVGKMPFGIGMPAMAAGFGLLIAGATRAVVRSAAAAPPSAQPQHIV